MTSDEFNDQLDELGYTNPELVALFGKDKSLIWKYRNAAVANIPASVEMTLRYIQRLRALGDTKFLDQIAKKSK